MKVLDLQCQRGHVFEGWFASEDDFQGQRARGLVQCPMCADDHIEKRLSAPRLNLGAREPSPQPAPPRPAGPSPAHAASRAVVPGQPGTTRAAVDAGMLPQALQAAWLSLARKILANTEDVGPRFAEEARRMHHGEVEERAIRGQVTPDEAAELIEEGVPVLPLPLPAAAKETLQ